MRYRLDRPTRALTSQAISQKNIKSLLQEDFYGKTNPQFMRAQVSGCMRLLRKREKLKRG